MTDEMKEILETIDASYKQGWKDAIEKFCLYMEKCNGYVVNGNKCNYDSFIKFMQET